MHPEKEQEVRTCIDMFSFFNIFMVFFMRSVPRSSIFCPGRRTNSMPYVVKAKSQQFTGRKSNLLTEVDQLVRLLLDQCPVWVPIPSV